MLHRYLPGRSAPCCRGASAKAARSDGPVPWLRNVSSGDGSVGHLARRFAMILSGWRESNVSKNPMRSASKTAPFQQPTDSRRRCGFPVRAESDATVQPSVLATATQPNIRVRVRVRVRGPRRANTLAPPTEAELPDRRRRLLLAIASVCAVLTDRRLGLLGTNSRGQIDLAMASDTYLSPRVL